MPPCFTAVQPDVERGKLRRPADTRGKSQRSVHGAHYSACAATAACSFRFSARIMGSHSRKAL